MKNKLILSIALTLGFVSLSFSQFIAHELGVTVGTVSFQSDYGERGDFKSTSNNIGLNVGLVYYMDFSWLSRYKLGYFEDHFKFKGELSYTNVKFEHHGRWKDGNSTFAQQLRAMHGSTSIINVGVEVVWFPMSIKASTYGTPGSLNPYLSFGTQYNHYTPTVKSDLGPIGSKSTTPEKYITGHTNSPGETLSLVGSVGTRYKIDFRSDITLDFRAQYYFSDWVDGLNPNPRIYQENKSNDFLVGISIGYIYSFD